MTTIPTARSVLRSCVAPLLGYAIAVGASLALMVLVVLAIAVQSGDTSGSDPSSDIDIQAIGTLVGMPFQLAGMALGGSLHMGDSEFSLSLFAPPLLVTAVFAFAVYRLSKASESATPSPSATERSILATSGAFATAVVATAVTRLLAMREDDVAMHSATVGLFLGVFLVGALAALLGRQAAVGSLWPRWMPTEGRRAATLVIQHLLMWMAITVPVAAVWLLAEGGPDVALFALVWGPTVALGAFAMGHLGALTVFGEQQFAWDLGWFAGVVLPLLAVLLTVTASIVWHLRRGDARELLAHPASWVSLPAAYAGAGLVVCLLSTVGLSGELWGEGGGVTVHGAYWLIPVLAVWGGVIEVLSRFAAPALARAVPRSVAARLAKASTREHLPAVGPTQRIPMSPTDRARAKKALIGMGVVGGLGLAGLIAVSVAGATAFSPEQRAEAYLDALVDQDAREALELAPVDEDEASSALLTDEIYGATDDRITGYEITDVETHGDTTTVTVDLEGPEDGEDVELTLRADGRRALLFRDWSVDAGGLAREVTVSLPESSTSLQVNDSSVPAEGGQDMDFWAWPGSYAFNPYGESEWLESGESRTLVPASESWGTYAEVDEPQPSEELREFVDARLEEWVDGCMASTELQPVNCPQDAYGSGDEVRNVAWTLTSMPTISWDGFTGTFPAELSSDAVGEASATYEYDASYGFGTPEWTTETEETSFWVNVRVDLVDDEPHVTFETY